MPKAASLAEELKSKFGVDSELIEDKGGVFDVKVNEQLIYSKHAQGDRFPEHEEVVTAIQGLGIDT